MAAGSRRPELVVIVGPTASGKSELAMKIATNFNGEVIAADSWTVYKEFDIGTSKPSTEAMARIHHHLVNVTTPKKGFNAKNYKFLAEAAIKKIQTKSGLPVIVGGTGLYIDSLLFDFGFLPVGDPRERPALNSKTIDQLLDLAKKRKIPLDHIDVRNKRRIVRAIEAGGLKPTKKPLRKNMLLIGLNPANIILKVEKRTRKMMEDGLEKEVKTLSKKYGWDNEPMKGIGYREWKKYFEGNQTLNQTQELINSSTKKLIKRQRTWFKRNKHIHWFETSGEAYKFVRKHLTE